jgi:aerobic-type carbon monoxide dehydrogenase small subunit (CoxS/CutS family)
MKFNLNLNGQNRTVDTDANRTLLDVLRTDFGLTGTKYGCGVGACGSCTVIIDGRAKCSCITLIGQVDGRRVETVEGLAEGERLHPLQESFVENHAIQCGYCTPGMLMSAKALLDRDPAPSEEAVRVAISGNLCRCTGYQQIVKAIRHAAGKSKKMEENAPEKQFK